ncbi:MAG TPA: Hsp20/alpha crystallin family protein [Candidatus Limnocylindria bacterium]|jgi:HSP20 family protein|nr:Hsp20/alpha crystallin family protein [Candidatus Limnocylindria bacterium]
MTQPTAVPVNVFENDRELVVVTPMPGVAAEDISVDVMDDGQLVLRARMHGEGQERRQYVLHEWTYGPFERTVQLPVPVDGTRANLAYGNGVLTVALPKADVTAPAELAVAPTGHTRGVTGGHAGDPAKTHIG